VKNEVRLRNKFDLNSSLRMRMRVSLVLCYSTGTRGLNRLSGCFKYKNTKLKKKGKEARMLQLFKYSSALRSALA
jgi:hypothetical protein